MGAAVVGSVVTAIVLFLVCEWGTVRHMNDFFTEAAPAYRALAHGHLLQFLRIGPAYVSSLLLRAPFALLALALGGGTRAVYFATALPCLIAGPILGAWLVGQPRRIVGTGFASRISPMVLCIVNPIVVTSIIDGHPEDVLTAVLCVAAVIQAVRGKTTWAGVLIGLALDNKSWAIVAVPVVFAVMPAARRRALVAMVVTAGAVLLPVLLARIGTGGGSLSAAAAGSDLGSQVGSIFLIPQLLWWFGRNAWIVREAHYMIVVVCAAVAAAWWALRGRRRPFADNPDPGEALLLLVLIFLLRASLDPWDNIYYNVPFLFAVMAYEARRPPRLTVLFTCLLLIVVPPQLFNMTPNARAAMYAAAIIPTILWLAARVFVAPEAWDRFRTLPSPSFRLARRAAS